LLEVHSKSVPDDFMGGRIELKKDVRFQQNTSVRQAEHEAMLRRRLDWDESGAMAAAKCPRGVAARGPARSRSHDDA
jgi:hypothetical protein